MTEILRDINPRLSQYKDRRFEGSLEDFQRALLTSTTVYVGNVSFYTTEDQIHEVFSRAGDVKRIIMGLDKKKMTPCGFCFVVYYTRKDTEDCVKYLNGTVVDDRPIRVDFDWGFVEGRQFGRGKSGGQVRDEFREDFDPGRGGFGNIVNRHGANPNRQGGTGGNPNRVQMGGPPMASTGMLMSSGTARREETQFQEEKRFRRDESDDE